MSKLFDKIKELRLKGYSYTEIKKEVRCAKSTISNHCKKFEPKFNPQKVTKQDIEKFQKIYDETKSMQKTAIICGFCKTTIFKYVVTIERKRLTPEENKKMKVKAVATWRKRTKIKLIEYKGGCCEKCGYKKSIRSLHFHHVNPAEKDIEISGTGYSFENLKSEVDKCMLLCANCHGEVHDEIEKNKILA